MSRVIDSLEREQLRSLPPFQAGDRVRVHFQVVEGGRRRTQVFEGVVIKRQGSGARETFTVRKQSFGVGVERTFPAHSPKVEQIELTARGDVRRAKLYYLRERIGRGARVRERRWMGEQPEATAPPDAEPATAEAEGAAASPDAEAAAPQPDAEAAAGAMPADEEAPRPGEEELAEATAEEEGEAPTPEEPVSPTEEAAGAAPSDEQAAEAPSSEGDPAAPEQAGDRSDSS